MNHRDERRLTDILDAITAIESHLSRGELSDGLIFDGVRIRLLEIGEADGSAARGVNAHRATRLCRCADASRNADKRSSYRRALASRHYTATSGSPSTLIAELDAQLGETGWSCVQGKGNHVLEKTVRSVHLWAQVSLYQGNVVDVVINDGPIPY